MKRSKKGFTLIEVVATLAILAVSTALSTIVIYNMSRTEAASAQQYRYNNQIDDIDRILRDYVSYVSLKTGDSEHGVNISFSSVSEDSHTITFVDDGSGVYSLTYAEQMLSIVFSGDTYCDNVTNAASITDVSNYTVAFDETLSLIKINYEVNGKTNHLSGIVRTN